MKQRTLAASAALMFAAGAAQAALQDEHNGQLYDNVTGLVWLQDANLAKTNTFGLARILSTDFLNWNGESGIDGDGLMTWSTANSWIAAMNAANYLGHNDWMLPTTAPIAGGSNWNFNSSTDGTTDLGYNISSQASQMGYMYHQNLGLKSYYSLSGAYQSDYGFGYGTANVGLVNNLQSGYYWSGTPYPESEYYPHTVWYFSFDYGHQNYFSQNYMMAAWPVRLGTALDVAAVPEPETYGMLLAGLGLIGVAARWRGRLR